MRRCVSFALPPLQRLLPTALTLALLAFGATPAQSEPPVTQADLLRVTRDPGILAALNALRGTGAEPALRGIVNRRGRAFFKDLREISKQVKDFDALSWISPAGEWAIFINVKHQNAPAQAIAALIAHESLHCDAHNSMEEEIAGWTQEAMTWQELTQRVPELRQWPSGRNALVDRLNRIAGERQRGTLETLVRSNKGYRSLPETSAGFEHPASAQAGRYPLAPPAPPRPAFELNDPPETFWDS